MVIVANKKIFGGGPYSTKGSRQAKMIGQREVKVSGIEVSPIKRSQRMRNGRMVAPVMPAYMPQTLNHPFHATGNSLGYGIQLAHLMGANPIYCMGFTLQQGQGYFFSRYHPYRKGTEVSFGSERVDSKRTVYDTDRALDWLEWYESSYPGRALLVPGWQGPVYDVLQEVTFDEVRSRCESNQDSGAVPGSQ